MYNCTSTYQCPLSLFVSDLFLAWLGRPLISCRLHSRLSLPDLPVVAVTSDPLGHAVFRTGIFWEHQNYFFWFIFGYLTKSWSESSSSTWFLNLDDRI